MCRTLEHFLTNTTLGIPAMYLYIINVELNGLKIVFFSQGQLQN